MRLTQHGGDFRLVHSLYGLLSMAPEARIFHESPAATPSGSQILDFKQNLRIKSLYGTTERAGNPNVAYLYRGKTRKSEWLRTGSDRAYVKCCPRLAPFSPSSRPRAAADGSLSRERSGFDQCRYATLGLTLMLHTYSEERRVRARQMWTRAGSDRMNST
jgi:hypothetical protein